jgi:protein phosphatase
MQVFEYTNKGCREENQDYVIHRVLSADSSVFIVADGMGGYSAGDIASATVGNAIVEFMELNLSKMTPTELLKEAIVYANDSLMLKRLSINAQKMGCVIVALLIVGNDAYLTWLGDSRLYMYRSGLEVYHTEDHSVLNELSEIKGLDSANIRRYSSMVTRAVMGDNNLGDVKVSHVAVEQGDIFLLCSDGFHKELNMDKALNYNKHDFDSMADQMSDNYSVIKVTI